MRFGLGLGGSGRVRGRGSDRDGLYAVVYALGPKARCTMKMIYGVV